MASAAGVWNALLPHAWLAAPSPRTWRATPLPQESAWSAGFFEELQRTADMKAYNGRTVERDRNINLK